jgi:hypothetical protein
MSVKRYGTATGRIPENLRIYTRPEAEFKGYKESVRCKPAFFTDAASTSKAAITWATATTHFPTLEPTVEKPNTLIPTLQLLTLEERGEGGRAWKALTPDGYLVDLREDVFLDVLFISGVTRDGIIEGPFQWVVYGTQMRLALVDSALYREIKNSQLRKESPKIPDKDLVIGGVYQGVKADHGYVFLGETIQDGKRTLIWKELFWLNQTDKTLQELYDQNKSGHAVASRSHKYTQMRGAVTISPRKVLCYPQNWGSGCFDFEVKP